MLDADFLTLTQIQDAFGDLSFAREALEKGWVLSRECGRAKGPRDSWVDLSVCVRNDGGDAYPCHAYAMFDLESGRFWGFQCSECGFDDGEGYCTCEHGATLALAFLLDPASFTGCPEGLTLLG